MKERKIPETSEITYALDLAWPDTLSDGSGKTKYRAVMKQRYGDGSVPTSDYLWLAA